MTEARRELLQAIIRNGEQGLAGPLGYQDRQRLIERTQRAQEELKGAPQKEA
jgi:hypothetical protein